MRGTRRTGWGRASRGFTIIEVIVIVVILGILAAVIGGRLLGRIGESKSAVAQANASTLATQMNLFLADHGSDVRMSDLTIEALFEAPDGIDQDVYNGPYVQNMDELNDPWGRRYILRAPGEKNVDFDIVSLGRDGEPGGEGEDADIVAP